MKIMSWRLNELILSSSDTKSIQNYSLFCFVDDLRDYISKKKLENNEAFKHNQRS
ncbi:unnamed protein product [Brassica rapa subsp. trilocularis]